MTKKFFGGLLAAALVLALTPALSAQSVRLTADIPFEFSVGNATLPAGSYRVTPTGTPEILTIRNESSGARALALASSIGDGEQRRTGQAEFVFNRYGGQYFLSRIVDGYLGSSKQFAVSRTERELAKTASVNRVQIVAMLASR
jgi:hypothetical protein